MIRTHLNPNAPDRREKGGGLYLIWWVVGVLMQILALLPWTWQQIRLRPLIITTLVFVVVMFGLESLAVSAGWWIWNRQRLWGLNVGVVPLEEFMLYWLVAPSVVVLQTLSNELIKKCFKGGR